MHPVWVNRDVPLYTVKVQREGNAQAFLVLTRRGPMFAKELAEHAGKGTATDTKLFPYPMISPSMGEIEQAMDPEKVSRIATRSRLKLWRFDLDCSGQRRICLVWTTQGIREAGAFAERVLMGRITEMFGVTNPILIGDAGEADVALESA